MRKEPRRLDAELSVRERQVLQAAADGLTVEQTAALLWLSPETVKSHRRWIYLKLDARGVAHAVAIGLRRGLIT